MIDGYGGSPDLLDSRERVLDALNELPARIGMQKLGEPVVYQAFENDAKDPGGWSGFVVIAESHISVHTFPKRQFVSIDAYTCRAGLDTKSVESFFIEAFALKETEVQFVKRGTRYPAHNTV